jgi:hypothetical protein
MTENSVEQLLFGEGVCKACGELKELVMVAVKQGAAVAYHNQRTGRTIAAPRYGYCYSCALEAAAAGRFGRPGGNGRSL